MSTTIPAQRAPRPPEQPRNWRWKFAAGLAALCIGVFLGAASGAVFSSGPPDDCARALVYAENVMHSQNTMSSDELASARFWYAVHASACRGE